MQFTLCGDVVLRNGLTPTLIFHLALHLASCRLPLATAGITQMSPQAADAELARLGCDVTGDYCVRRARLKRAARNRKAMMMLATEAPLGDDAKAMQKIQRELKEADAAPRYIAVVDFECTCEEDATDFPHEIIEFPMVRPATMTTSPTALFPSCLFTACPLPNHSLPKRALACLPPAPSMATYSRSQPNTTPCGHDPLFLFAFFARGARWWLTVGLVKSWANSARSVGPSSILCCRHFAPS
jgi:hypothetical protein